MFTFLSSFFFVCFLVLKKKILFCLTIPYHVSNPFFKLFFSILLFRSWSVSFPLDGPTPALCPTSVYVRSAARHRHPLSRRGDGSRGGSAGGGGARCGAMCLAVFFSVLHFTRGTTISLLPSFLFFSFLIERSMCTTNQKNRCACPPARARELIGRVIARCFFILLLFWSGGCGCVRQE